MNKTDKVKLLLLRGEFGSRDIAQIAECSRQWVTAVRSRTRAIQGGMTVEQKLERLHQDLGDLRRFVLHQQATLDRLTGEATAKAHSACVQLGRAS